MYQAQQHGYRLGTIDSDALRAYIRRYTRTVVVMDTNTEIHCYPLFAEALSAGSVAPHVIPAGEGSKSLDQLQALWRTMHHQGLDRHSLLIAIGGGVVGDLCGTAAATYMRGIDFLNMPTTLLAQVDASIGGKNGINFMGFKNLIGTIRPATQIWADPRCLRTLPLDEMAVGHVEMLKHGLIQGDPLWSYLLHQADIDALHNPEAIWRCAAVKMDVVSQDLHESDLRKQLNLGHTVGHALESIVMKEGETITHGAAVAYGMLVMAALSHKRLGLDMEEMNKIAEVFAPYVRHWPSEDEVLAMLHFMKNDKKNKDGSLRFVMMRRIGDICTDQQVSADAVIEACLHVNEQYRS